MAVLSPSPRSAAPAASLPDAAAAERRRWLALVVLCIGQLMIVLDATVVNVALPSIQRDLHFSQASLAWVVNGYLITFGGLLLLGGRLGDLLGRRRVFLGGLAAFTVASVLCGIAPGQELLVGARFLQGMGAATMSAMVLGILVTLFPTPRQTARAMSIYAFVASSGGAIGLLLGGVLTQTLSWHWIFFINVPIGIAAGVLGVLLIPRHEGIGLRHGIDVTGAVLVTAAPSLAIYAILQASEHGWGTVETLVLFAGALLLAALFVRLESRVRNPLVPLRIFRSRNATGANLVRTLFPVGMFGSFFLGPLYLQHVLGYSAMRTGLAYLPQSVLIGFVSIMVVGRLVSRFGARSTLIAGLTFVAAGLALFARVPVDGNYVVDVLPVTLLLGVGAGLVFMPSATLSMAGAGPGDAGILSGLANVAVQMGAALGVAVLAGVSASRTSSLVAEGVSQPAALTSGFHLAFAISALCLLAAVGVAAAVLRSAPPAPRRAVVVETAIGVE
ncbi:MAG TPA: DHA2 family efflux MFS transporter permease subunit [Candidatus Dormibacteraeota bacterium]|nr:DHA2 family efflux MFS transporter permease subunit [Candidatus Dormibacteraeota bacterium]